MEFPGWPSNDYDFHFEEAGAAFAGLLLRDRNGNPIPGILPSTENLLTAGTGWELRCAPFVAARRADRAVLLGGATDTVSLPVSPAPSANARIDVVYTLPANVGAGDPVEAVRVATGVPGAAPVKPSIPVGAIEIGTYRSAAGQTSAVAGTIANTFPFATTAGGQIKTRTKTVLDQINAAEGTEAYVLADRRVYTRQGNAWVTLGGKVLWAGTPIFLHQGQRADLTERIADQPTGIVMIWQNYSGGTTQDSSWNFSHIPKSQAGRSGGASLSLTNYNGTHIMKYVYVDAQAIRGHSVNDDAPANGLVLARVESY